MKRNPFYFGEMVTDENFTNRVNDLGTSGSIQKSISLLKKKNIIEVDGKKLYFNLGLKNGSRKR